MKKLFLICALVIVALFNPRQHPIYFPALPTTAIQQPKAYRPHWSPNPKDKIVWIEENIHYGLAIDMSNIKSNGNMKEAMVIVLFNTEARGANPLVGGVIGDVEVNCSKGTIAMKDRLIIDADSNIIKFETLKNPQQKPTNDLEIEVVGSICTGSPQIPIKPYLGPTPWNPTDPSPMQSAA